MTMTLSNQIKSNQIKSNQIKSNASIPSIRLTRYDVRPPSRRARTTRHARRPVAVARRVVTPRDVERPHDHTLLFTIGQRVPPSSRSTPPMYHLSIPREYPSRRAFAPVHRPAPSSSKASSPLQARLGRFEVSLCRVRGRVRGRAVVRRRAEVTRRRALFVRGHFCVHLDRRVTSDERAVGCVERRWW